MAAHLDEHDVPTLYRVHEEPDPLKVEEFEEFISTLGYSLGKASSKVTPRDFQKLVERMRGTPEEKPIAFLMLRTMQKARYDPSNLGHFGLAADSYTHFTSPIRRYPDLVVHRTLRESRHGGMTEERKAELHRGTARDRRGTPRSASAAPTMPSASWCSGRRSASWRTRSATSSRATSPASRPSGSSSSSSSTSSKAWCTSRRWPTTTTGSSSARTCCAARTQGKVYRLGDRVKVQVVKVDMERRQVDLGLVEILDAVRESEAQSRPAPQQGPAAAGARQAGAGRRREDQAAARQEGARRAQAALTSCASIVVGTAGHIDHGKSALVRALTGTDPDRLKEEQERGITIDLGFAH